MNKYFNKITVAVALCLTGIATAGEPLGIEAFRQMVVDYSQSIKMSSQNTSAMEAKVKMSRTGYLPSLAVTATGNYMTNSPMSLPGLTLKDYSYNANLTIQQNVYTGHAVRNQVLAAKIELDMASVAQEQTLQEVLYSADLTYWALSASGQQLSVMNHYVSIVENLYAIVSDRFNDGYISRTDLLMVQTRLNEAKLQQLAAQKLYQQSLQNTNSLVGQYQVTDFITTDTISAPKMLPNFYTVEDALMNRPEFQIAQLKVDLQNQNIKLARAKYNPQLVVGIQGVYGTPSINVTGDLKGYGVVFANFSAPIFHWGERRQNVAMAKASAQIAQYSVIDSRDAIGRDLANARVAIEQSFSQANIATDNLQIAQDNLELNTYSYSEGKLPILDVLSAQLAWIQSYTAAVNSNYQYKVSLADYSKALGSLSL